MFPLKDHTPSGSFPLVTILIIITAALVLGYEVTSPNPDPFIYKWSLVPSQINFLVPITLQTFVTSIFLHGGFVHFISNMWFLWIFGDNVEGALGKINFLAFYILGGVTAGFAQYFFLLDSDIPILGASGAIAAVLGFYFVNFPKSRIETVIAYPFFSIVELPSSFVLAMWFITQLFNGALSFTESAATSGVAWWAHIGGFVFGYVVGKLFRASKNRYGEII